MTEASCVISNMDETDILSGHVGAPQSACGESLTKNKIIFLQNLMPDSTMLFRVRGKAR